MQKCILIYDDDKEILMLCKMVLQKQNYRVETRAACDNIIDDIETMNPDVILMDLWIPTTGGEKALNLIRENPVSKNIPVLLFSANDEIEKISKRAGANGYIQKPFDIDSFKKEIEKWISKLHSQ
jgi:two-component system cell cycle response regulator DivK